MRLIVDIFQFQQTNDTLRNALKVNLALFLEESKVIGLFHVVFFYFNILSMDFVLVKLEIAMSTRGLLSTRFWLF